MFAQEVRRGTCWMGLVLWLPRLMIFHVLWRSFSSCFPLNKSNLMVALCCVYTGCLGEVNCSHSCVLLQQQPSRPRLLHTSHQTQSWDSASVTVPFSPAYKADHTGQNMSNWKIQFWSRRLLLTPWIVLELVHHQVFAVVSTTYAASVVRR